MKVGDKIWRFDDNRRVYPKAPPGKLWPRGGPIYREHWYEVEITGETSRSWVVGKGYGECKVPKKGVHHGFAFTKQELDDACYVHEHAHKLGDEVRRLRDAATLRLVANAIGYEAK